MGKQKQGSWNLPTYNSSGVINFSNPYGKSNFTPGTTGTNSGTFGFDYNSSTQDYYNQLDSMRKSIYAGLGYTSPAREASLNQWQDTFTKEALRNAQPQYEQGMFARGLGGSKAYSSGLADLLSNVNTQGVLNRENLSNQDQQRQLQYLSAAQNGLSDLINQANGLSQNSYTATNNQYKDLFPYLATYNSPQLNGWQQVLSAMSPVANSYFTNQGYTNAPGIGVGQALSLASTLGTGGTSGGLDLSALANLFGGGSSGSGSAGGMFSNLPSYSSPQYYGSSGGGLNSAFSNYLGG